MKFILAKCLLMQSRGQVLNKIRGNVLGHAGSCSTAREKGRMFEPRQWNRTPGLVDRSNKQWWFYNEIEMDTTSREWQGRRDSTYQKERAEHKDSLWVTWINTRNPSRQGLRKPWKKQAQKWLGSQVKKEQHQKYTKQLGNHSYLGSAEGSAPPRNFLKILVGQEIHSVDSPELKNSRREVSHLTEEKKEATAQDRRQRKNCMTD